MVSHRKRLLLGSMPVEGSSSSTTRGLPTMASAKESLRRVPPEHSSAFLPACSIICSPVRYASTILKVIKNYVEQASARSQNAWLRTEANRRTFKITIKTALKSEH